jgi:hypothetical protein
MIVAKFFLKIKKNVGLKPKYQGDIVIIWSLPKFLVSLRLQKGPELWPLGKEFYSLALGLLLTCFGLWGAGVVWLYPHQILELL